MTESATPTKQALLTGVAPVESPAVVAPLPGAVPAEPRAGKGPKQLVDAKGGAALINSSLATWWRCVAAGTLPQPFYPAPRMPRWDVDEVLAAVAATRARPGEPMARRRGLRTREAA